MTALGLKILSLTRHEAKDFGGLIDALGMMHEGVEHLNAVAQKISELKTLGLLDVQIAAGLPEIDRSLLFSVVRQECVRISIQDSERTRRQGPLEILFRASDLEGSERTRRQGPPEILFRASDLALQLCNSLDLSISKLSNYDSSKSMIIMPFFGAPNPGDKDAHDGSDIFVLMPFAQELKPVFEDHIKKVAGELNLRVKRADDLFSKDSVMEDVWNALNQAKLAIADCTARNSNVFYEIGIAHTINKPVILITQNENDVPFDLRHLRYIKYDYTPRGMIKFENQLRTAIPKMIGQDQSFIWMRDEK
jgi:hypothetical protein